MKTKFGLLLSTLGVLALIAAGCGDMDDTGEGGDNAGLWGNKSGGGSGSKGYPGKGGTTPGKKPDPASCYKACLGKGASFEACKKACYGGKDHGKKGCDKGKGHCGCKGKKGYGKGSFDHKCYFACVKKGVDKAKCKTYCTKKAAPSKPKTDPKTCYSGCVKKGVDAAKCKAYCFKKDSGKKDTGANKCKKWKDAKTGKYCYICWDAKGNVVKKGCESAKTKTTPKLVKPGCKTYKAGSKSCIECWDQYGKTAVKFCK